MPVSLRGDLNVCFPFEFARVEVFGGLERFGLEGFRWVMVWV